MSAKKLSYRNQMIEYLNGQILREKECSLCIKGALENIALQKQIIANERKQQKYYQKRITDAKKTIKDLDKMTKK